MDYLIAPNNAIKFVAATKSVVSVGLLSVASAVVYAGVKRLKEMYGRHWNIQSTIGKRSK